MSSDPAFDKEKHPEKADVVVSLIFALGGLHIAITGRAAPKGVFVEGPHVQVAGVVICLTGLVLLYRAIRKK
jgi:hypothetical protein